MTILAFWQVGLGIDPHAFDCCSHEGRDKQVIYFDNFTITIKPNK